MVLNKSIQSALDHGVHFRSEADQEKYLRWQQKLMIIDFFMTILGIITFLFLGVILGLGMYPQLVRALITIS